MAQGHCGCVMSRQFVSFLCRHFVWLSVGSFGCFGGLLPVLSVSFALCLSLSPNFSFFSFFVSLLACLRRPPVSDIRERCCARSPCGFLLLFFCFFRFLLRGPAGEGFSLCGGSLRCSSSFATQASPSFFASACFQLCSSFFLSLSPRPPFVAVGFPSSPLSPFSFFCLSFCLFPLPLFRASLSTVCTHMLRQPKQISWETMCGELSRAQTPWEPSTLSKL